MYDDGLAARTKVTTLGVDDRDQLLSMVQHFHDLRVSLGERFSPLEHLASLERRYEVVVYIREMPKEGYPARAPSEIVRIPARIQDLGVDKV